MHLLSHSAIARLTGALLLLITFSWIAVGQDDPQPVPPYRAPAEVVPKASVKGRVVYGDSERPVRRTVINLVQLRGGRDLQSATDRSGRFVIPHVPAGRYYVMVNAPGIITPFSFVKITADRPEGWVGKVEDYCTEVEVNDDNDVEVTVHARAGGVVSGKVTYADGDPAPNILINVMRREGKELLPIFTGISPSTLARMHTDDRGTYRITGLPPGEYLVAAAETHTALDGKSRAYGGFEDLFTSDALSSTYYGGSGSIKDATPLNIELGAEVADIDITLAEVVTHALGGTLTARVDGVVLPGANISITNRERPTWQREGTRQTTSDKAGKWLFAEVPDGTYAIKVNPPYGVPLAGAEAEPERSPEEEPGERRMRHFVAKEFDVTISGGDVIGLDVALAEGATISGVVELPPAPKRDPDVGDDTFVMIRWTYDGSPASESANTGYASDGKFKLEGVQPGKIYLNARVTRSGIPDQSRYVKSITLNGRDVMIKPLIVREGETIQGVRIVIAGDFAAGEVRLVDQTGKPISKRSIYIVPAEPARSLSQDGIISGFTDPNGAFNFKAPPGEYLVILPKASELNLSGPELMRAYAETAPHLKLETGQNKSQIVTATP